jgi:3',5'-cyclic AMP phosphodiesterase CpdA
MKYDMIEKYDGENYALVMSVSCSTCGEELRGHEKFCHECGAKLRPLPRRIVMTGDFTEWMMATLTEKMHDLRERETVPAPSPVPTVVPSPEPSPEPSREEAEQ